jgi:hypothetical protein
MKPESTTTGSTAAAPATEAAAPVRIPPALETTPGPGLDVAAPAAELPETATAPRVITGLAELPPKSLLDEAVADNFKPAAAEAVAVMTGTDAAPVHTVQNENYIPVTYGEKEARTGKAISTASPKPCATPKAAWDAGSIPAPLASISSKTKPSATVRFRPRRTQPSASAHPLRVRTTDADKLPWKGCGRIRGRPKGGYMNPPKPESAAAPVAPPETVQRWLVLLKDSKGHVEIMGQVHLDEAATVHHGEYWQAVTPGATAETVSISVPLHGRAVKSNRDLLPLEGDAQ